jgi:hypothetical protein
MTRCICWLPISIPIPQHLGRPSFASQFAHTPWRACMTLVRHGGGSRRLPRHVRTRWTCTKPSECPPVLDASGRCACAWALQGPRHWHPIRFTTRTRGSERHYPCTEWYPCTRVPAREDSVPTVLRQCCTRISQLRKATENRQTPSTPQKHT